MMTSLLQNIDEWGEVACDRYVCNETMYPYTTQEYYRIAVKGLEQSQIWMPEMVTGFQKKSNFKRRILRMKNYKKENEMKLISGVALSMMLCIVTSTSIFAAGEGFKIGYEKIYEDTKYEVQDEMENEIEYEEKFDASKVTIVYDDNSWEQLCSSGDLTEQKLGKKQAANLKSISISGKNMITVSLSISPTDKRVKYGIVTPEGNLRYVYGTGMCAHTFEVTQSGTYKIYVENVDSSEVTIRGTYTYL